MRLWAEEKQIGTIEFLLTLPLTNWQAVLAKFIGALIFLMIALLLTITLPLTLWWLGPPDWGPIIGSYLGACFLGGAYLAIGLFVSSLTKNQIIAFIMSLAIGFLLFIVGEDFVIAGLPPGPAALAQFIGLGRRFSNIARGVVDSRDVIYYLSLIWFALWLNVKVLTGRKWQ